MATQDRSDARTADATRTESSGADSTGTDSTGTGDDREVFRIQPIAYFAVPMMLVVTFILAGGSPAWFGWTLVLPFVLGVWIRRIRTVADTSGLRAVGTLRTTDIAWGDVSGLAFSRWGAPRAVLADGSRVRLPAVTFRDLPRLSAASGGRIPDPYAAADAATRTEDSSDD